VGRSLGCLPTLVYQAQPAEVGNLLPEWLSSVAACGHPGNTRGIMSTERAQHQASMDMLRDRLSDLGRGVVAFSGGGDSALLACVAHDVLGDRALAATAVSPSLAHDERDDCAELAAAWGLAWHEVHTDEMATAAYVRNDADRCYWCKEALVRALRPLADTLGSGDEAAVLALGVNVDDLADHRPGQAAARERGAVFPLVEAGFTKADVRDWSRRLGLQTWDKPAAACLASRLPYGTPVTLQRLSAVQRAEHGLRRLGYSELRVRHYDETARIEVPVGQVAAMADDAARVVETVKAAGYRYVTLDLEALRSGNLNAALTSP